MLNQSGIRKQTMNTTKTILADITNQFSVGCKLENTGVTANAEGKKMILAGTPLKGNIKARETAFSIATSSTDPIVGIALNDVDVTAGTMNGSCLVFGFVDMDHLDATVVTMIGTVTEAKLPRITFIK